MKPLKVLSLFDGISCGLIALERAGIPVERYVAYEIDENAIEVSKKNYPQIEHFGDVINTNFEQFIGFDLLIGGSPCQDLCGMGKRTGLQGEASRLFYEFLRAKLVIKPKYFLLENNASMTDQNKNIISDYMGVQPIMIDSADFSAQTRKRLYWTNIQILDYQKSNILLKDILEKDIIRNCVDEKIEKYVLSGNYEGRKINKTTKNSIRTIDLKSRTIGCFSYDISSNTGITLKIGEHYYQPSQIEFERLQTLPDNYTSCLPIKQAVHAIGNGWTVDVIAHIFKGIFEENNTVFEDNKSTNELIKENIEVTKKLISKLENFDNCQITLF